VVHEIVRSELWARKIAHVSRNVTTANFIANSNNIDTKLPEWIVARHSLRGPSTGWHFVAKSKSQKRANTFLREHFKWCLGVHFLDGVPGIFHWNFQTVARSSMMHTTTESTRPTNDARKGDSRLLGHVVEVFLVTSFANDVGSMICPLCRALILLSDLAFMHEFLFLWPIHYITSATFSAATAPLTGHWEQVKRLNNMPD